VRTAVETPVAGWRGRRRAFADPLSVFPAIFVLVTTLSVRVSFASSSVLELTTTRDPASVVSAAPGRTAKTQGVARPASESDDDDDKGSAGTTSDGDRDDDDDKAGASATSDGDRDDDDDKAGAGATSYGDRDDDENDTSESGKHDQQAKKHGDQSGDSEDSDGDSEDAGASKKDDDANDSDDDQGPDTRPTLETRIDHYQDSEHFERLITSTLASTIINGFFVSLRRDSFRVNDRSGAGRAESTVTSIHKDLSETFGVGGGFGTVRTDGWSDWIGSVQASTIFHGVGLSANVKRDMLLTSAAAIRTHIRQTEFGAAANYEPSDRFSADLYAHHTMFSDGNSSNYLAFEPEYSFDVRKTKIGIGYEFNYLTFAKNFGAAYWSPQRSISNDATLSWSFDFERVFGRLALGAGHESVRETGLGGDGPSSGFGGSGAVSLGLRPTDGMLVQFYWNTSGSQNWHSTSTGMSLQYSY
jgi:hypothetical protein